MTGTAINKEQLKKIKVLYILMGKNYKCHRCGEIFKTLAKYERHIMKIGIPCNFKIEMTINGNLKMKKKEGVEKSGFMVMKGGTPQKLDIEKNPKIEKKQEKNHFLNREGSIKENPENLAITTDDHKYKEKIIEKMVGNRKQYQCRGCGRGYWYCFHLKRHIDEKKCGYGNDGNEEEIDISTTVEKNEEKNPNIIFNVQFNNCLINTGNMVINNTINVKNFGEENIMVITENLLHQCIEDPEKGLIDLIQHIHFNPDARENTNVKLRCERGKLVEVYEDGWKLKDAQTTIHNLLTSKKDIMDDKFDLLVDNKLLSKVLVDNYEYFSNLLNKYLKENMGNHKIYRKPNVYNFLRNEVMRLLKDDKQRLSVMKKLSK